MKRMLLLAVIALSLPLGAFAVDTSGADNTSFIYDGNTRIVPKYAVINTSASGNTTLVAAVSGKRIRVLALIMVSDGTVGVRFQDGTNGTNLTGKIPNLTSTGFVLPYSPIGWFQTTAGTLLNLNISANQGCFGCLVYVEV